MSLVAKLVDTKSNSFAILSTIFASTVDQKLEYLELIPHLNKSQHFRKSISRTLIPQPHSKQKPTQIDPNAEKLMIIMMMKPVFYTIVDQSHTTIQSQKTLILQKFCTYCQIRMGTAPRRRGVPNIVLLFL